MNDNKAINTGIKKIFLTILTQGIILLLSFITGFVLPQKMGPENYGYWQVYLFYLAYLNIFGIGFNDGLALYYGGYKYSSLPFEKIRSAIRIFYGYLLGLTVILLAIALLIPPSINRNIYVTLVLSISLTCIQCIVLTLFLAVNKTGIYNIVNLIIKISSVGFYIILLFFNHTSAVAMMNVDLLARLVVTIICIVIGMKFFIGKSASFKDGLLEIKEKAKSGINITIAIIASMFIPVCGRLVIEWNEPIATYGIYSFSMSLLTIIMAFTSTAGMAIFPLLKQLNDKELPTYYKKFVFICDSLIYIALLAYVPLVLIIQHVMTKYIPALDYFYILLAMCVPLGRMQLLVTPYYKAYRLEKQFLLANIFGVVAMLGFTMLSYYVFSSIIIVAIVSTSILTIWTYFTERYILKKMQVQITYRSIITQITMMSIFIIAASLNNIAVFIVIYLATIVTYLLFNRKKTEELIYQFRHSK